MKRPSLPLGLVLLVAILSSVMAWPPEADPIRSVDHKIEHVTNVPGFEGKTFVLAVRERVPTKPNSEAVLCIHGLHIPGTVVFDLPREGYSWLRDLAEHGYRAYSLDLTGYGGSTRPTPMKEPRNVALLHREMLNLPDGDRPYPFTMTSADSDLHDIDTAVEFIRKATKVERVHLVGTSLGGARSLVYAARHPDKVGRVVIQGWGLAFAVDRKPEKLPAAGGPVELTTADGFKIQWKFMTARKGQVEDGMPDVVWKAMQASIPDGESGARGVMRSPGISLYGWNKGVWDGVKSPVLLIHNEYDPLNPPGRASYAKMATPDKVNLIYAGSSHVPYWETGKGHLFAVTREWLGKGTADGKKSGEAAVDVEGRFEWK